MLTAVVDDAGAYGRVVRAADGAVARVVEARDASPEELAIGEYNAGLYVFDRAALEPARSRGLATDNAQGELLPHRRARAMLDGAVARAAWPTTPRRPRASTTGSTWRPARPPSSGACARS